MITLHLLEYMKTIPLGLADEHAPGWFWEKLPLGQNGVGIYSVGGERPYGGRGKSQIFDLECRGADDTVGYHILEKIAEHFNANMSLGELPAVPDKSNRKYHNCRVVDVGNIQNLGFDANDQVIFKLTARIIYKKGQVS